MMANRIEKVYIDTARCKGCGYCIHACPKQAVSVSEHVNESGYHVIQIDEGKCIACGICYTVCPDYVFEIV